MEHAHIFNDLDLNPFDFLSQPDPDEPSPNLDTLQWQPEPLTNVTTREVRVHNGIIMPLVVSNLQPVPVGINDFSPRGPNTTFGSRYLTHALGTIHLSTGYYSVHPASIIRRLFPKVTSFRVLDAPYDPLVPQSPGSHGAHIAFPDPEVPYDDGVFPVFLQRASGTGFRYLGMYRHPSRPDFLSRNEMAMLPLGMMMRLCNWILLDGGATQTTEKVIGKRIEEVVDFTQEDSGNQLRQFLLGSDFDSGPKLRLVYEYLEFVAYEPGFYECLVNGMREWDANS